MKVIACIEDSVVINKILGHLKETVDPEPLSLLHPPRAPPGLFG